MEDEDLQGYFWTIQGLALRVQGLGFRAEDLGFWGHCIAHEIGRVRLLQKEAELTQTACLW